MSSNANSMLPTQIKPYVFPLFSGLGAMVLVFLYLLVLKQIDPTFALNRTNMEIYLYTFIPTFLLGMVVQFFISSKMYYMIENLVIVGAILVMTLAFYNFVFDLSFIPVFAFASIYYFEDIVEKKGGKII